VQKGLVFSSFFLFGHFLHNSLKNQSSSKVILKVIFSHPNGEGVTIDLGKNNLYIRMDREEKWTERKTIGF